MLNESTEMIFFFVARLRPSVRRAVEVCVFGSVCKCGLYRGSNACASSIQVSVCVSLCLCVCVLSRELSKLE